ncbi:MAG: hypothetical protein QOI22_927, partial [Verrucomicrobiota bacterium]
LARYASEAAGVVDHVLESRRINCFIGLNLLRNVRVMLKLEVKSHAAFV